jgi:hypothetical protein
MSFGVKNFRLKIVIGMADLRTSKIIVLQRPIEVTLKCGLVLFNESLCAPFYKFRVMP